jgi:hypothetical protein
MNVPVQNNTIYGRKGKKKINIILKLTKFMKIAKQKGKNWKKCVKGFKNR